jgi:hypothetical protein
MTDSIPATDYVRLNRVSFGRSFRGGNKTTITKVIGVTSNYKQGDRL